MNDDIVQRFRQIIEDRIAEIDVLSKSATGARSTVELDQQSVGRLSRQDALQQQAMAVAQEKRRAGEMIRLQKALVRIDENEFGYCENCGEQIPEKRLEIDPTTEICVDCRN